MDFLLLRNNSLISARAWNKARGGNITIDADTTRGFVVAPLLQNSNIIASATQGNGGNITINARQVFGLTQGKAVPGNRTNYIDASSQFNQPGAVTINTPDIDPSRGLVALPVEVVDATRLIDQNFCAVTAGTGSSFTITGHGGLPPSPDFPLRSDIVWEDWQLTTVPHDHRPTTARDFQPVILKRATPDKIVEAAGWMKNEKGEIELTATPPTVIPLGSRLNAPSSHT